MQIEKNNKLTSGTQEWCYKELNIGKGCPNNCFYCYAKRLGNRFGWKTDWEHFELNEKMIKKGYRK